MEISLRASPSPLHHSSNPHDLIIYQCDQVSPACSQCLRAGKQCPGYRDQLALMFRDENEKVVTKARVPKPKPEQRKRSSSFGSLTCSSESASPSGSVQEQAMIPRLMIRSPSPAAQDEGIKFFFNHYVTEVQGPWGDLDIVETAMFPLLHRSDSFANAVSSVGYAGLSNVTKDPKHMIVARRKYVASLRDITRALGDVANSDLDATLKSVLLLAAFEVSSFSLCFVKLSDSAFRLSMALHVVSVLDLRGPYILMVVLQYSEVSTTILISHPCYSLSAVVDLLTNITFLPVLRS